ncbi:4-carboxymuconolactone decarboxylase [Streptomyces sp. ISL-96]|uniref:bifunctional 3-oxoadipate enol-lactonase/4-carboxymuconolactone decarboxylase PcaDC n=1 Tax=Streptomyces sp. ISL-96 TaxID=2819191 RepID=UPI001BE63F0B|nr:4-carboxymuconolactone decarboxylase [Streptomyces sp. ISL-96]MBT2492380.1 4-carboxymuconolactone decarboxylase [Streptomyces sp. ISL-96]
MPEDTHNLPHFLPHVRLDGPESGTPLILGPSVGTSLTVWEPQLAALARVHRVLRWDLPGHGGTPADVIPRAAGTATVADLAALVLRAADAQGWESFAYAGVSIGGAVGLHLAAHYPERVTALAVVCSSARFGEPATWRERATLVRAEGTEAMVASRPGTWFAPAFASTPLGHALIEDLRATDPAGYAACCDALAVYDLRGALPSITAPTLVVAGRDDPATPPAHAREITDAIPGSSLLEIAGAAHLAGVEKPETVTNALLAHFAPPPAHTDASRHAAGMRVRRAVLGSAHVDRAVSRTTPFTARFQDFITRYAWGEIWTSETLDRRTRSCITLTALVAHGHEAELALHVRAALTNGLTRDEIGEVLLQTAVYCGVPAANSAFAVAQSVFDDLDRVDYLEDQVDD